MDASQPPLPTLEPEGPEDGPEVVALDDRIFGPGRFTKVSERVREFATFRRDLSFCARRGGRLVGTVRQWLVHVGGRPVIFLGPLAVEEAERRHGVGAHLVEEACRAAEAAGFEAVLLVGDLPYFRKLGFEPAPGVTLPGPVDPKRVLVRRLNAATELPVGAVQA